MKSDCTEELTFLEGCQKTRPIQTDSPCFQVRSDDNLGARWKFWRRRRDAVCIMSFFGFVNVALLRYNISIAIVAMTSDQPVLLANGTIAQERAFNWDSLSKGAVLSSFYCGYIVSQIPGGWLAFKFGGHKTYGIGVCITAFLTLISPTAADVHIYFLVAIRIAEGLCEGLTFPSMEIMIARWTPLSERNRFGSVAFSGMPIGSVLSMVLPSYLASYYGWKSIFYVSGSFGAVWAAFWWVFASEDPSTDSRIKSDESLYIITTRAYSFDTRRARTAVPWLSIISCVPLWSAVFAGCMAAWNFHALTYYMPTFVKDTMKFDLKKTGLVSALPSLFGATVGPLHGYVVDIILTRRILSVTVMRKLSICGSLTVNSIILVSMGNLQSTPPIIACLVISVVLGTICSESVNLNCLDMAPQFSSVIIGIEHTVSNLSGVISPTLVGYIVRQKSLDEWRTVFNITSGLIAVGALVYGVLGSGERQVWAKDDDTSQQQDQPQSSDEARPVVLSR